MAHEASSVTASIFPSIAGEAIQDSGCSAMPSWIASSRLDSFSLHIFVHH